MFSSGHESQRKPGGLAKRPLYSERTALSFLLFSLSISLSIEPEGQGHKAPRSSPKLLLLLPVTDCRTPTSREPGLQDTISPSSPYCMHLCKHLFELFSSGLLRSPFVVPPHT
mmetsp:Transcript_34822/g.52429  ORF Transcript_34822/g.52429 Transcript_34822/m.52429 type:complete len:113 (-) Transcript_34822:14-352(-)